jgi:hypothetical protein
MNSILTELGYAFRQAVEWVVGLRDQGPVLV